MPKQTDRPIFSRIPHHLSKRWDVDNQNSTTPIVEVFLTPKTFIQINQHCRSDLNNEVGGWLLGSWCWDDENKKQFIVVDQSLIAPHTEHSATHLTFTQDSQVALSGMLEEFYPDKIVVGWYHTHPRMSIFLSNYDLWLHKYFFSQPWQVAMVVEPYSHTGGIFIRDKDNQLSPNNFYGFNELINSGNDTRVNWKNVYFQETPNTKVEENNVTI